VGESLRERQRALREGRGVAKSVLQKLENKKDNNGQFLNKNTYIWYIYECILYIKKYDFDNGHSYCHDCHIEIAIDQVEMPL